MPLPPAPTKRGALLSPEAVAQTRRPAAAAAAAKKAAAKTAAVKAAAKTAKPAAAKKTAPRRRAASTEKRLFVLDTNVLLHDPLALFHFQEHDIYLPLIVLEELDAHKKGTTEVARNGRQSSRYLDALISAASSTDLGGGLPLGSTGFAEATGRLWLQTTLFDAPTPAALPQGKADNQILGVVAALARQHAPRPVVLVSKDINMRVKARALGLLAEDYQSDRTLGDGDLLYCGALALPQDFWARQGKNLQSWQEAGATFYRVSGEEVHAMHLNQFVWLQEPHAAPLYTRVTALQEHSATLRTLRDFTHPRSSVWGVMARNREQNFALNLLMDPDIDFVTIAGIAGTGKTLLALAAGLAQVLDERRYSEIIMTRATVAVGDDIGFLPGTEEEKMQPWMGALDDNLEFLARGASGEGGQWGRSATQDLIRSRIKIRSMNFMRGRTFIEKWVIIDEAQNLTPKQIKTLITRAGPGSKIICMGNLEQIDTPYLSEGSSGLAYAVDRFKGWAHSGHITLARGERSRLADWASEVL